MIEYAGIFYVEITNQRLITETVNLSAKRSDSGAVRAREWYARVL